ncbi:hypothetical protein [Paraburkholderia domus]|uniref:Integrase n=1 Tax=Paraburkholderia domus TaxID=2793075 RepID=A0A9N8NA32_9BURK|nr:hypothetical protein [Paraburkholderia domus]CAE6968106.1 hypothetical protein R70211_07560 [Paraburkholderia domus]
MNVALPDLSLNIDSPLVTRSAGNFQPPTWPPPLDFPVTIDKHGTIISRYRDAKWNLAPWAKKSKTLNFGDGPQRIGDPSITPANAALLRQIAGWWLWGPRAVTNPTTLLNQFNLLRPLFILCSNEGISASALERFPAVADKLPAVLLPSRTESALALLHSLFEQRERLGFTLLDFEGLRRLEAALPETESRQTPYIPPRIWTYQVNRLRAFLDDFLAHRQQIEDCYRFCLDAYAKNYGSLADACRQGRDPKLLPFSERRHHGGARSGAEYLGSFSKTAQRFGIDVLLERWCLMQGQSLSSHSVNILAMYFSMTARVGIAYLLNFSMMRIREGWSLRADCLEVEQDMTFGAIYLLRGVTTKTIEDDDARWITSPSAQVAVQSLTCVARLRMIAADANPDVPTTRDDIRNPYLVVRPYEPWANTMHADEELSLRPIHPNYQEVVKAYPKLFDVEALRITESDIQIARLITPSLDGETFAVGKIWPLAWHQLRRTGAVNMQASGLVSDASVQYQLKHATRAMSLYYGQGYSRLHLNDSVKAEYIRTMYEVLGKEISRLFTDRFVSPYGAKHKALILGIVAPEDSKKLAAAAKQGRGAWRETLLGGCTKRGPCDYGGVDNVARCGGGDGEAPCAEALFDREQEPAIRQLGRVIDSRLADAPEGSPYRQSLEAQQRAIENALYVLATK